VLSAAVGADERVSAAHHAKLAYVYVRQSSVNQVRQHQESTELQYRLSTAPSGSVGRVSASASSTRISASQGRRVPSDMASSG